MGGHITIGRFSYNIIYYLVIMSSFSGRLVDSLRKFLSRRSNNQDDINDKEQICEALNRKTVFRLVEKPQNMQIIGENNTANIEEDDYDVDDKPHRIAESVSIRSVYLIERRLCNGNITDDRLNDDDDDDDNNDDELKGGYTRIMEIKRS